MCEPIYIAAVMAAVSVATTGYQVKQSNDQAYDQAVNANETAKADYVAVASAADQTNASANAEALKLKRQALIERGRLIASQSETGFVGNSPLREIMEQRTKEEEALGTIQANQANALVQNTRDANKIFTTAMGRVNEARSKMTSRTAAGLMIASSGVKGAGEGYQYGKAIYK